MYRRRQKNFSFRFSRTTVLQETVRERLRNGTERCVLRAYRTVFRIFTRVPYRTVFEFLRTYRFELHVHVLVTYTS